MTAKQYRNASLDLCRQFKPITDKPGEHGHEFMYSGWRVHLQFRHKSSFGPTWFSDWIHIGINDCHNLPPFCDHWKWNIHYSGGAEGVRAELLRELLRRLNRLAEHYDHAKTAPADLITAAKAVEEAMRREVIIAGPQKRTEGEALYRQLKHAIEHHEAVTSPTNRVTPRN